MSDSVAAEQDIQTLEWRREASGAAWSIRDSMAHAVFRDRMWLFGGFTTQRTRLNDIWSSPDGVDWTCHAEHAPWPERNLPAYAVHNDAVWIMGGLQDVDNDRVNAHGDVWRSRDGVAWEPVTLDAPWGARGAGGAVSFRGRLWVMGGFSAGQTHYREPYFNHHRDIWSTADGGDWRCETRVAPWGERGMFGLTVHDDRLWLTAGGVYDPSCPHNARSNHADVWVSDDGVQWSCVQPNAPWSARRFHRMVSFRQRLWVIAGYTEGNRHDVWSSADGKDWVEHTNADAWSVRHEPACFVHRDRLWLAGGFGDVLFDDVWSTDGATEAAT